MSPEDLERQARTTSEFSEEPEPVPVPPPPTVPARDIELDDCPCGGAKTFARAAIKLGLRARLVLAQGPWLQANGLQHDEREVVRVEVYGAEDVPLAACWWTRVVDKPDWKVHRGMTTRYIGPFTAKQLKTYLTNPEEDPRV